MQSRSITTTCLSFQNGDKGNKAQEALNNLENAANNVGEAISELEAAMED
jgi:hypothetical protein